jgi:hypothetical protein
MVHGESNPNPAGRRGGMGKHPRVVIFDTPHRSEVAVVDLPSQAAAGTRFCHHGTSWRVVGARTPDRVLICQPAG